MHVRLTAALCGLPLLVAGCLGPAIEEAGGALDDVRPLFLTDGDFERFEPVDSGTIADACTNIAPWGADSWGLNAATFNRTDDRHALEGARFRIIADERGKHAAIWAKESVGTRMGFARFIQGNTWGGTHCGPAAWRIPAPEATFGRRLALQIDVLAEESWKFTERTLLFNATSHVMMAFNVWLRSPALPKRLVMDLAMRHECNWGMPPCGPQSQETDASYHYITRVGDNAALGRWERRTIDLSRHIEAAAQRFGFSQAVRETLAIEQVEFLVEVMDGQGSVHFDNVALLEVPEGLVAGDRTTGLDVPPLWLPPVQVAPGPEAGDEAPAEATLEPPAPPPDPGAEPQPEPPPEW